MKKQFIRTRAYMLCLCTALSYYSFSQCGTAPTAAAGTTTINNNNAIVNSYYPGTGNAVKGTKSVPVGTRDNRGSNSPVANGDLVLIIQMQGADFNTSNNDAYGDGVAGGNASGYLNSGMVAGNYEYNVVSGLSGGVLTLTQPLAHNYYARAFSATTGIQTFQVIRIQREYNLTIDDNRSITAPVWNGSTGGVVVLEVANRLEFGNTSSAVRVDGKGFRGGGGKVFDGAPASTGLANTDYVFNSAKTTANNKTGGAKGEGIAGTPMYYLTNGANNATTANIEGYIGGSMGRGAPGNAGGGGTDGKPSTNEYNTGGGGGGNGGAGGHGGSGWDGTGTHSPANLPYGGYGGTAYTQASSFQFVMGGGGGAGTSNNAEAGDNDYLSSGACGGGIIIIRAKTFAGNGIVSANGAAANESDETTDAAGGGGAGGSIVVLTNTAAAAGTNTIKASATGGRGGDMSAHFAHGPGGGGGGGFILTNALGGTLTVTGGANGLTHKATKTDDLDQPYGSTPGADGIKSKITGNMGLINVANPASPCGSLPITLTKWSGVYKNNRTYLNWQAENAINFAHFVVERSTDGVHFSPLGEVATVADNALTTSYSFEDAFPVEGVNYYRLKMVDIDGQSSYSGVLIIRTNGSGIQITASPNPFTDHVVITIQSTTDETANLRVFNSEGKLVWHKTTYVNAGTNVQYFNELQTLPKGAYLIKVDKGNTTGEFKVIKQ